MWTRPGKGILQSAQSKERIRLQVRRLIATVQFRVSNYHPAKDQGTPNRMAYLYERVVRSRRNAFCDFSGRFPLYFLVVGWHLVLL